MAGRFGGRDTSHSHGVSDAKAPEQNELGGFTSFESGMLPAL